MTIASIPQRTRQDSNLQPSVPKLNQTAANPREIKQFPRILFQGSQGFQGFGTGLVRRDRANDPAPRSHIHRSSLFDAPEKHIAHRRLSLGEACRPANCIIRKYRTSPSAGVGEIQQFSVQRSSPERVVRCIYVHWIEVVLPPHSGHRSVVALMS